MGGLAKRKPGVGMSTDFATAVRDAANEALAEGELSVRVDHGLAAQALLDRRMEKQADRKLQVELARLLAGGRGVTGIGNTDTEKPAEVNVTPVPEGSSEGTNRGLAPLALVFDPERSLE
jgi:hypothetical protein